MRSHSALWRADRRVPFVEREDRLMEEVLVA